MKRTLALILVMAFAAIMTPVTARADDAATLLARHRSYVGMAFGDGSLTSFRTTEQVTLDKDKSVIANGTTQRLGIVYRRDRTDVKSKVTQSNGFTGNVFWSSDENGVTVPIIGDAAKALFASDIVFSDAITKFPWALQGTDTLAGSPVTIFRITAPNALPLDIWLDQATGAVKRFVIDKGGDYDQTVDVLGYIDAASGIKVIGKWKILGSLRTSQITKVAPNGVQTGDLHPPEQTAVWTFANPDAFPITITDTRIIVKAKVNGVDGTFILDTGADAVYLSKAFAEKAKVKTIGTSKVSGIGGESEIKSGSVDSILVGGNTLSHVAVFSGIESPDKAAPDGLLGFDFIGAAIVTVDFAKSTLRLRDPNATDLSKEPGLHIAADMSSGQPSVPFKVNGTANLNAILDTGAPTQVLLPYDFIFRNKLRMLFRGYSVTGGVSGGYDVNDCGNLDTIALGQVVYQSPEVCESPSFGGSDGLIGFSFLKSFASITFDYQHTGMIFVPQ